MANVTRNAPVNSKNTSAQPSMLTNETENGNVAANKSKQLAHFHIFFDDIEVEIDLPKSVDLRFSLLLAIISLELEKQAAIYRESPNPFLLNKIDNLFAEGKKIDAILGTCALLDIYGVSLSNEELIKGADLGLTIKIDDKQLALNSVKESDVRLVPFRIPCQNVYIEIDLPKMTILTPELPVSFILTIMNLQKNLCITG